MSIEADGRIGRLTQEMLKDAITDYPATLVPLPPDGMYEADVYPAEGFPGEFAVDIPHWTAEEGRSDLTLVLTVVESADTTKLSIDDLYVP